MMTNPKRPLRPEIEALLPWHAAGTLNAQDAERVEAALAQDPELAREYEAVRQELGETIRFNETLGVPSARAMARLMADIDADQAGTRVQPPRVGPLAWLAERLAGMSPRTLAWSAGAAAAAILLQAIIITGLFVGTEQEGGFKTVSYEDPVPAGVGTFVLVRFAPAATAAEITGFLQAHGATLIEGPKRDATFRLRVAQSKLPAGDLDDIVKRMQGNAKVVTFVAPSR